MIKYAKSHCKILPVDFEENINNLFKADNALKIIILKNMIIELKKILPDSIAGMTD